MNKDYYINRVKYLEGQLQIAMEAIDKAITDVKILRGYLEFPHSVAECAVMNRRYFDDLDSAYIGGYEQALNDIKKSLGIESYITKDEINNLLKDIFTEI